MSAEALETFGPLRDQLLAAAQAFAGDAAHLAKILTGIIDDVERAAREPLEIFPVCHHSPASAVHMVKRLQSRPPRVIFMECCEDLRPLLDGIAECSLPIALQAFASQTDGFPSEWAPLNLVCPLTEFSAEFQAIAFALKNPGTELVFVDRSADHVFQWSKRGDKKSGEQPEEEEAADDEESAVIHQGAVAIEVGATAPTFGEFVEVLLRNARVAHYSEWWDQYVEDAVIGADYARYREVFFLVGSLVRRLGRESGDIAEDELRERYMWTRMKQHLTETGIAPPDALYICGAAHSASRVAEFGAESPVLWEIPPRTQTEWLYGLLPSSYAAIERQFSHPPGSVSLAEERWSRELRRAGLKPLRVSHLKKDAADEDGEAGEEKKKRKSAKAPPATPVPLPLPSVGSGDLTSFLCAPPPPGQEDEDALVQWCVRIVASARKHGYMASTADSIAVYHTSILLANLRNRPHPTPWDFRDAAITCLEKDFVPKRRSIARLCDVMLGGDRIGKIGYESMPPLARDVYDRLKCLPIQLEARNVQRALLDFSAHPEWLPASDLLWKLRRLLAGDVVRPIMGQRELGAAPPRQESWDLAIGRNQGAIIQLGYDGLTVEFVLEQKLRRAAFASNARTIAALAAAEDSILYLKSERLTADLGAHALTLLINERDVSDAPEIHRRISRFVHYYRSFTALPEWCGRFVTGGYSHYCTLLPTAFGDRGVKPGDLAAMLQFILTLESLALSLGCERSQFVIAIRQASITTTDPIKLALLWSVECVLQLRTLASLREQFDRVLNNPIALGTLPAWLNGFLLSLSFTPVVAGFTVELMSKAFAWLPDQILMPWLPQLLRSLRAHATAGGALATLMKEASSIFPRNLAALESWEAPWDRVAAAPKSPARTASLEAATTPSSGERNAPPPALLRAFPVSTEALARVLGLDPVWAESQAIDETAAGQPAAAAAEFSTPQLLCRHPATMQAWAAILGK